MMRGVQDASPEDPDSFALHVKERNDRKPPVFTLLGKELQTRARELNHSHCQSVRSAVLRQYFVRRHFRQAQKLAKESAFGQQLVLDDLSDATGLRMWFERKILRAEFMPDGVELVCFTRVSLHEVLENAGRSNRNVSVVDSNFFVVHINLLTTFFSVQPLCSLCLCG